MLTVIFCFTTWYSVKAGNHFNDDQYVPWSVRLTSLPISYAGYLWKTVNPSNLAVLYRRPEHWPTLLVTETTLILLVITTVVLFLARRAPYLIFGWFMFLGILVPTCGLVSVGMQDMADRYMYLPSIGLFIALVWAVADWSATWKPRVIILSGAGVVVLAACAVLSWQQVQYWHDSFLLWQHCLATGYESDIAHYNLGGAYLLRGDTELGLQQYRDALQLDTNSPYANQAYGTALQLVGKPREATNYFARTLALKPDSVVAHENFGYALIDLNDFNGAVSEFTEAIRLRPIDVNAHTGMGMALSGLGQSDAAIECYDTVLKSDPAYAKAHFQLGLERLKRGETNEAIASLEKAEAYDASAINIPMQLAQIYGLAHKTADAQAAYRRALRLNPNQLAALNNLAFSLATTPEASLRNGPEAGTIGPACLRLDDQFTNGVCWHARRGVCRGRGL